MSQAAMVAHMQNESLRRHIQLRLDAIADELTDIGVKLWKFQEEQLFRMQAAQDACARLNVETRSMTKNKVWHMTEEHITTEDKYFALMNERARLTKQLEELP
jgi:hypothetical protein